MIPDPQTDRSLDPTRSSGRLLGIGDVASLLDDELGNVSVSKIRYLESRGLITPARTRGGSRRFSAGDVDRLRTILILQRRHFLPLDVIAEQLDAGATISVGTPDDPQHPDSNSDVEGLHRDAAETSVSGEGPPGYLTHALRPGGETAWSREEFVHRVALDSRLVDDMQRHGLLDQWNDTGMQIALVVYRLAQWGIEPRHLRGLGQAADRQIALIESTVPIGQVGGAQARADADEARRRVAASLIELHILLVRAGLSR